jgi:phospholipase C
MPIRPCLFAALSAALCAACSGHSRNVSETESQQRRAACEFKAGALPADSLWTAAPRGDQIPIDHVVIVMQENRSFDHYFSRLPGANGAADDATNPDADGTPISRYHETQYCTEDVAHAWNPSHREWNGGVNDGFVTSNNPNGKRSLGFFDETDLPFYYSLARGFATSDAHHCSLLGPTLPNRMYSLGATSWSRAANFPPPGQDKNGKPYPNILTRLDDAKVSWAFYTDGAPSFAMFVDYFSRTHQTHAFPFQKYLDDAAAGTLPSVVWVEGRLADEWGGGLDEHPPGDMQNGQQLVATVVKALIASSAWKRSVLFWTYDEHGGFYDHVPPPPACIPDDLEPGLDPNDVQGRFDRFGFRVPFVAVSPYAKRGFISHRPKDHTSMLRFIETRWNLPALSVRDANSDPMFDMFDFDHPQTDVPALADATPEPNELSRCMSKYPR